VRVVHTYREMMRRTAGLFGRRPTVILKVPMLSPRLSTYWVSLVTPVKTGMVVEQQPPAALRGT
jgi:hypothetical protein